MQFRIGQDTVGCYGADVRHNTVLAFRYLDTASHERIAATFYWNTLPQTQTVRQSYGLWSFLEPKKRTLTKAIDLTRPLFEVDETGGGPTQAGGPEEFSAVVAAPGKGQQPQKGNSKGWRSSKGWNQRWSFGKRNQPQKGKGQSKGHGKGKGYRNHRRATQEIGK
ncbi:hypothetical protein Pmar_PMAR005916 [Perkinsus marinus ATCC 50983]|uniref:Uncharacterized protein n=1 Tax=Perkinsus marinus (strain ATCC 50983 / TXsc) TaxID=423536 RepID=C5LL11_PERM5|nr:hypothetical protein Pmar_PMAR005916 [Perkinsus marinus ATCC 50983]EER02575.1 hypothetical protein Pmar_PMAR005916 [Perkinsus marinus ATCC 50983]|eukprot:XP_002769857.1 hypothetical protein Pmar_PMAR005916 [Perkinsus marinus ATCC 50983]